MLLFEIATFSFQIYLSRIIISSELYRKQRNVRFSARLFSIREPGNCVTFRAARKVPTTAENGRFLPSPTLRDSPLILNVVNHPEYPSRTSASLSSLCLEVLYGFISSEANRLVKRMKKR